MNCEIYPSKSPFFVCKHQECLLSVDDFESLLPNGNGRYLVLKSNDVSIVLEPKAHVEVSKSNIVCQEWVLNCLNFSFGAIVHCGISQEIADIDEEATVHLLYTAHQSHKHWDEVYPCSLAIPGAHLSQWPENELQHVHVPHPSVGTGGNGSAMHSMPQRLLAVTLGSYVFGVGSLMAVEIMHMTMMFQVVAWEEPNLRVIVPNQNPGEICIRKLKNPKSLKFYIHRNEDEWLQVKKCIDGDICPMLSASENVAQTSGKQSIDDPKYDYTKRLRSKIVRILSEIFRPLGARGEWKGARTMLVSAPGNADKRALVHRICNGWLRRPGHSCGRVVNLSGSDIITIPLRGTDDDVGRNDDPCTSVDLLTSLCAYFSTPVATTALPTKTLVIIHDVDLLYPTGIMSDTGNTGETTSGDLIQTYNAPGDHTNHGKACLLLKQLISLLSSPANHKASGDMVVLGLTNVPFTTLLKPHIQAVTPHFELLEMVPAPSATDRYHMITRILVAKYGASEFEHQASVSSDIASGVQVKVVDVWATQLSGLTPAYLSVDLVDVIRKAIDCQIGIALQEKLGHFPTTSNSGSHSVDANSTLWVFKTPRPDGSDGVRSQTAQGRIMLTWNTVLQAIASMKNKKSSSTGSVSDTTPVSWSEFGGYHSVCNTVRMVLSSLCNHPPMLSAKVSITTDHLSSVGKRKMSLSRNVSKPKGMVLHGPHGCGKSYLASVIATEGHMNFISVRSTDLISKYFGETESSIRQLFVQGRAMSPCVLFFDEFDILSCRRGGLSGGKGGSDSSESGWQGRVLSTFLNELDGISSTLSLQGGAEDGLEEENGQDVVFVIAACSDISQLDEALLRPGRLQYHISLGYPTLSDIEDMLRVKLKVLGQASDGIEQSGGCLDIPALAAALFHKRKVQKKPNVFTFGAKDPLMEEGNGSSVATCAEVDTWCRRAVMAALLEEESAQALPAGGSQGSDGSPLTLLQRHFVDVLALL